MNTSGKSSRDFVGCGAANGVMVVVLQIEVMVKAWPRVVNTAGMEYPTGDSQVN